jgi:SAM-dependent methyltransferase
MKRHKQLQPVSARTSDQLAAEWDELAEQREGLISEGRDLSYRYILLPRLRELSVKRLEGSCRVLDAGCGTGTFVWELADAYPKGAFLAIDPSERSVEIAREKRGPLDNLTFRSMAVESLVHEAGHAGSYDLVIANMLLQNVASLPDVLAACSRLLKDDGALIFAIPHPCFWPRYWRYDEKPWFRYGDELWIDAPFKTSLAPAVELRTTHAHRPLTWYFEQLAQVGLVVEKMCEPMPDAGVEGEYPVAWEFPRFLLARCLRLGRSCGAHGLKPP